MGYFTKNELSVPGKAGLSIDLVSAALDQMGANYQRSSTQNELGGFWDSRLFRFLIPPETQWLTVFGHWNVYLDSSHRDQLEKLCADWNGRTLVPKVYVLEDEDGTVSANAEYTVGYFAGVIDGALGAQIEVGISTANDFFDTLDEAFPAQAAAALERQG